MSSVMDLALESEESVYTPPNVPMRMAIGFAHYLRRVQSDPSFDPESAELAQWYRAYGYGLFRARLEQLVADVDGVRISHHKERYARWGRRQEKFWNGLIAKDLSWGVRDARLSAWNRRNPRPLIEPDALRIAWCADCGEPKWGRSMYGTVRAGASVCGRCFQDNWRYCSRCGDYYRNDENHYHPPPSREGSRCAAPMERFRMPNVLLRCGYQPSDRIVRVINPDSKGRIASAALPMIAGIVKESFPYGDFYESDLSRLTDAAWQTQEGNYTKRLRSKFYKAYDRKLTDKQVERIGNIARQYMVNDDEQFVEFTRKLDRKAYEFNYEGSCWFTGGRHRCVLKQNAGMAMRLFENANPGSGYYRGGPMPIARAWVVPLDSDYRTGLTDPMEAERFLLFNAYGRSGQEMSGLLAAITGRHRVQHVELYNSGMYVNDSSAYLIGGEPGIEEIRLAIDTGYDNVRCGCITHQPDIIVPYPYDDSDFSTALLSEPERRIYEGEDEEEPDD